MSSAEHERAGGDLCVDNGDGWCAECGVGLTTCDVCSGVGYHRAGCPDSDEQTGLAHTSVRGHAYPAALRSFSFFHDSSWVNDDTDSVSFSVGNTPLTVWIDHVDRDQRIASMMSTRFALCRLRDSDPHREFSDRAPTVHEMVLARDLADEPPLLETDDPDALLAFLRNISSSG